MDFRSSYMTQFWSGFCAEVGAYLVSSLLSCGHLDIETNELVLSWDDHHAARTG